MTAMPPNTQQVCDNCRLRKTRCDRRQPCSSCTNHSIHCQYLHSPRRRGPKGGKGRNLDLIKRGQQPLGGRFASRQQDSSETVATWPPDIVQPRVQSTNTNALTGLNEVGDLTCCPEASCPHSGLRCRSQIGVASKKDFSAVITRHIHIFLEHMLPILPVVSGESLLKDATNLDRLATTRLALLLSLSAATRLQLKLDGDKASGSTLPGLDALDVDCPSGLQFLSAAEHARQHRSLAHDISQDAVLTSFFLFVSYENLHQDDQAWFYLNQSISMAILLGIDRDGSATDMSAADLNMRRRIFWLLFVTERQGT